MGQDPAGPRPGRVAVAGTQAVAVNGPTPQHPAAEVGHTGDVQALLADKAVSEAVAVTGPTPLHLAAEDGHTEAELAELRGAAGGARAPREELGAPGEELPAELEDPLQPAELEELGAPLVVLAAVASGGWALEGAADELRAVSEVALAAGASGAPTAATPPAWACGGCGGGG